MLIAALRASAKLKLRGLSTGFSGRYRSSAAKANHRLCLLKAQGFVAVYCVSGPSVSPVVVNSLDFFLKVGVTWDRIIFFPLLLVGNPSKKNVVVKGNFLVPTGVLNSTTKSI